MSDHSVYCAANACPCFGAMSTSTTGGGQWYCSFHFGCKPERVHEITNELCRLSWLVKITQEVRANGGSRDWDKIETAMNKEIRLNMSPHLLRGDHESLPKWLARLEDTLRIACAAPEPQQPLDITKEAS